MEILYLNPSDLVIPTDPTDPLYDERVNMKLDPRLTFSVGRYGIRNPVIVRPIDGGYTVVDGRQRVRAAIAAGVESVPCQLDTQSGTQELQQVSITLNECRVDDSPLVKARKAARLLEQGHSVKDVAAAFGLKSTKQVGNWVKLLDLTKDVQRAVDRGDLTPTAAIQLHGLEPAEQNEKLWAILEGEEPPTVESAKRKRKGEDLDKDFPPRSVIKKVAKLLDKAESDKDKYAKEIDLFKKVEAHYDFWYGVDWALGRSKTSDVPGLRALITHVTKPKE